MTTHPALGRISPFAWLLLQAAAIVGSILLAFAIDAWWGERKEVIEKNALLESVRSEMQSNRKRIETDRVYRQGAMDSAKALLAAIESGRYEDGTTTLDHRLADLTWFSDAGLSTVAVESLLDGGLIAAVESERLRHYLVALPRAVEALTKVQAQDYETLMHEITAFLGRNASLLQNPEFEGLLVRKMWNDGDVLYDLEKHLGAMDEIVALIDQELTGQP